MFSCTAVTSVPAQHGWERLGHMLKLTQCRQDERGRPCSMRVSSSALSSALHRNWRLAGRDQLWIFRSTADLGDLFSGQLRADKATAK